MKKIITIALLTTISLSTIASANSNDFNKKINGYYVKYSRGIEYSENSNYGFIEPMQNIVGGESIRQEIEAGVRLKKRDRLRSNAFLYAWLNDKEKHNEHGIGVGANIITPKLKSFPVNFLMTAKAGLGNQNVNDKSLKVTTNSNALRYIFNGMGIGYNLKHGNYSAVYKKDITVFEIGLGVGVDYDITKNISLIAEYTYLRHYYDYAYLVEGNVQATVLSSALQDNHYFEISLSYKF